MYDTPRGVSVRVFVLGIVITSLPVRFPLQVLHSSRKESETFVNITLLHSP